MADEIPKLADHPEEAKLRQHEESLAETFTDLAAKLANSLKAHDRVETVVLLTQLEQSAGLARKGFAKAIDDQMKATREQDT